MFVKVSNPMIKAMKKAMPEYSFKLLELTPESYQLKVDYDLFRNESDFNIDKHIFKNYSMFLYNYIKYYSTYQK